MSILKILTVIAVIIFKLNVQENITQTFIVLNTNLYYNNKAKTNESDPCGQVINFTRIIRTVKLLPSDSLKSLPAPV
jgi:hypothetical protein